MKSPFPGMDPYLEQHWEDVGTALIVYVADALEPQLPQDLFGRIESIDCLDSNEPLMLDPVRLRSVQIFDSFERRITRIEILSPWIKAQGDACTDYLKRRAGYIVGEVNLVEIDLIRAGDWTQMIEPQVVPADVRTPYRVNILAQDKTDLLLYPISLDRQLPTIAIPLRRNDP